MTEPRHALIPRGTDPLVVRYIRASESDVRVRGETILGAVDALAPGEPPRLHVDHEARPLFYLLQAERPGVVAWESETEGPQEWVVLLRRVAGDGHGR